MGWTITVGLVGAVPLANDDTALEIADVLADYGGVVSIAPALDRITITLSVDDAVGDDRAALAAAERALGLAREAGETVGLDDTWELTELEILTFYEQDRRLREPLVPPLVGVREVSDQLGVSRQRVSQLAAERSDFPRPVAELAAGPVWFKTSVDKFVEGWTRQTGRPRRVDLAEPADGQSDARR